MGVVHRIWIEPSGMILVFGGYGHAERRGWSKIGAGRK